MLAAHPSLDHPDSGATRNVPRSLIGTDISLDHPDLRTKPDVPRRPVAVRPSAWPWGRWAPTGTPGAESDPLTGLSRRAEHELPCHGTAKATRNVPMSRPLTGERRPGPGAHRLRSRDRRDARRHGPAGNRACRRAGVRIGRSVARGARSANQSGDPRAGGAHPGLSSRFVVRLSSPVGVREQVPDRRPIERPRPAGGEGTVVGGAPALAFSAATFLLTPCCPSPTIVAGGSPAEYKSFGEQAGHHPDNGISTQSSG